MNFRNPLDESAERRWGAFTLVELLVVTAITGAYNLADYGPVKTAAEVEATLKAATADIVARGGGVLIIAPGVCPDWVAHNPVPSSTRVGAPNVTLLDRRNGYEHVICPANGQSTGVAWAGRSTRRFVTEPIDMAMGVHSTETVDTYIAGGTASYDQPILSAVKAGESQRVYVPTIRGIFTGMHLILSGAPGYGEPYDRVVVKAIGWDAEKRLNYFVADLKHDHPQGALAYNKHVVNSLSLTDHSNSDNQSMGLAVKRKNYGQGDSFVISANIESQGNVMSGGGDEGGLCYDDFEKGDPIAQAIGQDPWNPTGMRVRHHNYLPSTIEDNSFQAVNFGRVGVDSVLCVAGGTGDLDEDAKRLKDNGSRFGKVIDIHATSAIGVRFGGDVRDAAIWFQQPHDRAQPIWWSSKGRLSNSLTVDPKTAEFALRGGPTHLDGVMLEANGGLSGTATPARNLRGIAVAVKVGVNELAVQFERPDADAKYALYVQPNWITPTAITKKSEHGFVVSFEKPPANAAAIDWIFIR
ncbi:MAG: hypothetical protein HY360_09715 [Verrucomicrobia bacterium]|nr:hypothetical protein [Verrucomicrobiota bacterium]